MKTEFQTSVTLQMELATATMMVCLIAMMRSQMTKRSGKIRMAMGLAIIVMVVPTIQIKQIPVNAVAA